MINRNNFFAIWLFGLISGFTLMLSGSTLNYWLSSESIDLRTIGIFAVVSLPYTINFIWAPILDTIKLGVLNRFLDQHLSWLFLLQFTLSIFLVILSYISPQNQILLFAIISFIIALLSSTQDSVLGGLKTIVISRQLQKTTVGFYTFGYRIGILISTSGAIYLSHYVTWSMIYKIFAVLVLIFPFMLTFVITKDNHQTSHTYHIYNENKVVNFMNNIAKPIGSWTLILLIMGFLILYRLPDNFINTMINPFFIYLDYSSKEIAFGKFIGIIGSILGGFITGIMMKSHSIQNNLLTFGIIHAIAHVLFIINELYGHNLSLFFITIIIEAITGGMAMSAYIVFISSLCKGKFRATQYSFLSSMMGLSRSLFPTISGYIVYTLGWSIFFIFVIIITIPALFLLIKINSFIKTDS